MAAGDEPVEVVEAHQNGCGPSSACYGSVETPAVRNDPHPYSEALILRSALMPGRLRGMQTRRFSFTPVSRRSQHLAKKFADTEPLDERRVKTKIRAPKGLRRNR